MQKSLYKWTNNREMTENKGRGGEGLKWNKGPEVDLNQGPVPGA